MYRKPGKILRQIDVVYESGQLTTHNNLETLVLAFHEVFDWHFNTVEVNKGVSSRYPNFPLFGPCCSEWNNQCADTISPRTSSTNNGRHIIRPDTFSDRSPRVIDDVAKFATSKPASGAAMAK